MSVTTCNPTTIRPTLLSALTQMLRRKSPAPRQSVEEWASLPDHLLVDIGIDPKDVSRPAQRELDRAELLYRGWRPVASSRRHR